MNRRYQKEQKILIIKRFFAGERVIKVCKAYSISRTTFYKWLKEYNETILTDKKVIRKPHWRKYGIKIRNKVLKAALKNPSLSPQKLAKLINISTGYVWQVLSEYGLNTIEARNRIKSENGISLVKSSQAEDRISLIRHFQEGESVTQLCIDYGISRTTFYKWLKRYISMEEKKTGKTLDNLRSNEKPQWRYDSEAKGKLLAITVRHAEFTRAKKRKVLVEGLERKINSTRSLYKGLKRYHFNIYMSIKKD